MKWEKPHISKIYEALTAIADSRLELVDENNAKCYSSSGGKFYLVEYDPNENRIMSNDNTAYFTSSVSYPMIALLMRKGKIAYNDRLSEMLKGIHWKDVNQRYANDYDKAVEFVLSQLRMRGINADFIQREVKNIHKSVCDLELSYLGKKRKPPIVY